MASVAGTVRTARSAAPVTLRSICGWLRSTKYSALCAHHLLVSLQERTVITIESDSARSAVTKYKHVPGFFVGSKRVSTLTLVPDEPNPACGAAIMIFSPHPALDELIRPPLGWHCSVHGSEINVTCNPTDSELLEHLCTLLAENPSSPGLFYSWTLYSHEDRKAVLTSMLELSKEDATHLGHIFASRITKLILRYREWGVDLLNASLTEMEWLRTENGVLPS
jgi:hypothetical protein